MYRVALVLLALGVAVGLAGCGKSKVIGNGIVLEGHGQVKAMPDVAEISITVETSGAPSDRTKVTSENARKSGAVRRVLAKAGVKADEISTESYNAETIQPYDYYSTGPVKKKPYFQVVNSILVTTKAAGSVGRCADAAMKAGATSVDSITYRFDDTAREKARALALAVKDAKVRALAAAKAWGVKLLPISRVREMGLDRQYGGYRYIAASPGGEVYLRKRSVTYTSPKMQTITADVVVTFAVERP